MGLFSVEDYRSLAAVTADHCYAYGAHPSQFGDLYLPTTPGPHPVLTLIHGGCWRVEYGLAPLGQLARALTRRGAAVWSIEYRRLGDVDTGGDTGDDTDGDTGCGWPVTFLDAGAALDFLRTVADQHALDLSRIVTAGHSAGGHLALWLAGRAKLPPHSPLFTPNPLPVHGALSIGGIPDLAAAATHEVCGDAVLALMGGSPVGMADRYADASPAALTPLGVAHIHIHGCEDTIVPLALVEAYVAFAVQAGDRADLVVLPSAGHFEPVDARTPAGVQVIATVMEMLTC